MGGGPNITRAQSYSLVGMASVTVTPLDATTYYIGSTASPAAGLQSNASVCQGGVPLAGTIIAGSITSLVAGTLASAETSTVSVRINTTDTTLTTAFQNDTLNEVFTNTSLSIAVSAGDFFQLKWVSPTWVTDPTNLYASFVLVVQV